MKVTDGQKGGDLRLHQRQSQKEWDEIERTIRPFSTQFSRFLLKPIKKKTPPPSFLLEPLFSNPFLWKISNSPPFLLIFGELITSLKEAGGLTSIEKFAN